MKKDLDRIPFLLYIAILLVMAAIGLLRLFDKIWRKPNEDDDI